MQAAKSVQVQILRGIIVVTMFSLAIDAGGQMGIRALFPIGLALILLLSRKIVAVPYALLLFGLMVAYPTCLYFVGLLRNASPEIATSQFRSTLFSWGMMIALSGINYVFLARALYSSIALTALIATIGAVFLLLGIPVIDNFFGSLSTNSAGYFGLRGAGESLIPNVQFKSTLFFVPAALYFLLNRKFVLFLVCLLGLTAGVSKSGIAFVLAASLIFSLAAGGNVRWFALAVGLAFSLLLYNSPMWELFAEIGRGESFTMDVRQGHYDSIVKLFSEDLLGFTFGFGLGSEFYSEGAGEFVSAIELDHLNTIRKYGIIWSSVFFYLVVAVSLRAVLSQINHVRILGVCLISAFIVAGTNPVLISPIFFLILFITIQATNQATGIRRSSEASRDSVGSCESATAVASQA